MDGEILISVVSPVFKGEKMIADLVRRIRQNISVISENYEIILVNDASPDASWREIEKVCKSDSRVKGIDLSRNFGQHYAITAGLSHAKGRWVVVMDCDLQDRPEEISNLYQKAQEGYDVVFAQRTIRQDNFLKRLSSTLFYLFFSYLTDTKQDKSVANFGIFRREVIQAVLSMNDHIRYFPAMVQWVGFKRTNLPVQHDSRQDGTSGYNFFKLMRLATDTILAFSDKPLKLTVKFGFLISFSSLMLALYYLLRYLWGDISVSGFTTIILSIWFIAGVIVVLLGVLGLYIGKIFDKVKERPLFIINQSVNL